MNYKSFVLALGLLIVSGSCVYAQNKGKQVEKAVKAAVTEKVPVAGAAKAPRVPTVAVPTPKASVAPRVPTVNTMAHTAARAGQLPPPVSAAELAGQMKAARQANVEMPAVQAPASLPRPQFIPQFEDIGSFGDHVIGLEDAVEEFAVAHNRRGLGDMRDISKTFKVADFRFKEAIENGDYSKPYQEVWLKASKNIGRTNVRLKRYTEPDSPLQPLFKLREQQLQHALNPEEVARPVDQRLVLLDETSVRMAQEIKSLAKNLNVHDPLRADIQDQLGVLEEQAGEGTSSRAFLDISHQLPSLEDEVAQYSEEHGRYVWGDIQIVRETFKHADKTVFVTQGNKVYADPNISKGTSYVEMWKKSVDGRSVRSFMSAESPFQKAFELRQEQLDYLLSNRDNFLVDPSLGNEATARTAREIQDKLSGLPENNPLRKRIENSVNLEKYANIGQ